MAANDRIQKMYRTIGIAYISSALLALFSWQAQVRADFDPILDSPMYRLPDVPLPTEINVFPEGIKELWLKALERPEADMRYKAAEAIAEAHRRGMKGLESTISPLVAALDRQDQPPTVRLAIARALIELDARPSAANLFRQAQAGDNELRELVEPTLARWDYRPARAIWLEQLRDPAISQRSLILAIRGLSAVREEQAVDPLRELVLAERTAGPIRLESARALGAIRANGLEKDAERLTAEVSPRPLVPRLAAASLLRRHRGPEAIRLLQRWLRDPESTVAALAVARLLEIDPQFVAPAVEHLLANPDANLRSLTVDALGRRPSEKHVHLLSERLDDEHAGVRTKARRYLQELGRGKKWRDLVFADGTRILQTKQWRGLEQATILLTLLDHKQAANRFLELLSFDRPEVSISAAWGLRKLDIPETLPPVLRYVESKAAHPAGQRVSAARTEIEDHVLSQLHQFLGQRKYRPADAVLRAFVPKQMGLGEARAAAIWALGMIHEGETIDALAAALEERLNDQASIPPEVKQVRVMSAFTLGRLSAKKALPSLRKYFGGELSREPLNNACGWAIARITGVALPAEKPLRKMQRDWFLVPQP